jgi:superfamily I DNA and/or RNA helicase
MHTSRIISYVPPPRTHAITHYNAHRTYLQHPLYALTVRQANQTHLLQRQNCIRVRLLINRRTLTLIPIVSKVNWPNELQCFLHLGPSSRTKSMQHSAVTQAPLSISWVDSYLGKSQSLSYRSPLRRVESLDGATIGSAERRMSEGDSG